MSVVLMKNWKSEGHSISTMVLINKKWLYGIKIWRSESLFLKNMFFIKETVYSEKVCIIKNKCRRKFSVKHPQNITKNALEQNEQVWGLSYNMDHFTFRWTFLNFYFILRVQKFFVTLKNEGVVKILLAFKYLIILSQY